MQMNKHFAQETFSCEKYYIYYFQGEVPEELAADHSHFIGNWQEEGFSFLFFSAPADDIVDAVPAADSTCVFIDQYEMTSEQWHGEEIRSYTTGCFSVSPPWKIAFVNQPGIKHLLLDPGVVFGTGRHQTTSDCLGYIEYLFNNETIDSVVDMGTGTGLLAIGAAAMGCRKILALDFNRLAVKTALNNIRLNAFEDSILAIQARAEDYIFQDADLLVANIHYDVMKKLLETRGFYRKKWVILSGLLRSEAEKVVSNIEQQGVIIVDRVCHDGVWNTILGKNQK